ncbi:MAG: hypothetical protein HYS81_05370 [Candidatus Aenigmatarchaeota archaeon]|nr:MAG: hypothetical protein HYS81_05370 [Candidatus Aenigmarchaeota archaeon]
MSKLSVIRTALEKRKGKDIVVDPVAIDGRRGYGGVNLKPVSVLYRIAPREGIFDVPGLNAFMLGMVPDIKPDVAIPFIADRDGVLNFGHLRYDEAIGEQQVTHRYVQKITADDLLAGDTLPGFRDGVKVIEKPKEPEPWMRMISLRFYPHVKLFHNGPNPEWRTQMPLKELRYYQPQKVA